MTPIVLDASVILSWCFEADETGVGDAAFRLLKGRQRWIPSLLPVEISNFFARAIEHGKIPHARASQFMSRLRSYGFETDYETADHALQGTHFLALEQGLSVYDAVYLELAIRKGAMLATLDLELRRAALSVDVEVVTA